MRRLGQWFLPGWYKVVFSFVLYLYWRMDGWVFLCIHVCMGVCMCVCNYACKHVFIYACTPRCIHGCAYVCMYAFMCVSIICLWPLYKWLHGLRHGLQVDQLLLYNWPWLYSVTNILIWRTLCAKFCRKQKYQIKGVLLL